MNKPIDHETIPGIGEGIKIPNIGLVALTPLSPSNLPPTPLNLHKQVALLSQSNNIDYSILNPDQYLEVLKYAQENCPALKKSLMKNDDIISVALFEDDRRGKMHTGFRLEQKSGLWERAGGIVTATHEDISYCPDGTGEGGVFAITNSTNQKDFLAVPWEFFIPHWPINYAVRAFIPERN